MNKIISTALSAFMAFSLAGCANEPASNGNAASSTTTTTGSDKQTVVVAVMCPLSGEYSRFGEQYKAAIEAAMKYVNENDMLKDYELQFEYVDDKGTTDGAPTAANLALDQYECNVAVGHMLTTMVLADGQYFEDAETPLLGIVSGPASVSQGWQYISIETGTDISQADTLIDYLVRNGSKNISLVNINTEGGMSAAQEIEDRLKDEYQMELATHEQIDNNVTDFTSIALKMKDAGTDTVVYWGLSQANGQICYTAVKDYVGKVTFAGGTNLAQNQMLTTWNSEDIDGVVFPVGYIYEDDNEMKKTINGYYKELDPDQNDLTDVPARVVDSIFHIVSALNTLDAQDPKSDDFNKNLNSALRNAKFTGVQGDFDFSANDNGVGLNKMSIGMWDSDFVQHKVG